MQRPFVVEPRFPSIYLLSQSETFPRIVRSHTDRNPSIDKLERLAQASPNQPLNFSQEQVPNMLAWEDWVVPHLRNLLLGQERLTLGSEQEDKVLQIALTPELRRPCYRPRGNRLALLFH